MSATTETLTRSQAARRNRVIDAAFQLAGEGGYDAVQMRDVASTASVALGTIYRYFSSKDHLLAACQVEWSKDVQRTRGPRRLGRHRAAPLTFGARPQVDDRHHAELVEQPGHIGRAHAMERVAPKQPTPTHDATVACRVAAEVAEVQATLERDRALQRPGRLHACSLSR